MNDRPIILVVSQQVETDDGINSRTTTLFVCLRVSDNVQSFASNFFLDENRTHSMKLFGFVHVRDKFWSLSLLKILVWKV